MMYGISDWKILNLNLKWLALYRQNVVVYMEKLDILRLAGTKQLLCQFGLRASNGM